jgi:hypothetical protein
MQCVARRWAGTATTCERPPNTQVSKELESKLAQMKNERLNQDTILFPTEPKPNDPKSKQVTGK